MRDTDDGGSGLRLQDLPQGIEPARDLWPAIASALAADTGTRSSGRISQWRRPAALAAVVALLAVGFWVGRHATHPLPVSPMAARLPATGETLPTAWRGDPEYVRLRQQLEARASIGLASLAPSEQRAVAASLATIQRAVADLEAALGNDPANALLQILLVQSCQEEMRVLSALERMSTPSEEQLL